ncbi:uncharacterized protein G2W53_034340 [Senna tora]|uniref:Uncharacterized protein n=1 Tax=Senna tora TaxID=362788 RepID=A0A834WDN5_9FABA|nr:uncharacterized protein G2W53_034340 [Senna tora]
MSSRNLDLSSGVQSSSKGDPCQTFDRCSELVGRLTGELVERESNREEKSRRESKRDYSIYKSNPKHYPWSPPPPLLMDLCKSHKLSSRNLDLSLGVKSSSNI